MSDGSRGWGGQPWAGDGGDGGLVPGAAESAGLEEGSQQQVLQRGLLQGVEVGRVGKKGQKERDAEVGAARRGPGEPRTNQTIRVFPNCKKK